MLGSLVIWSASVWYGYINYSHDKNNDAVKIAYTAGVVTNGDLFAPTSKHVDPKSALSNKFWQWEGKGRLALIDSIVDDMELTNLRINWASADKHTRSIGDIVQYVINVQMNAYGAINKFENASVKFIPLRGDANGLYIPQDETIYLNSRMSWEELSFERLIEVVLHENMHHIMTKMHGILSNEDILLNDFASLHRAAYFHGLTGMAQDSHDIYQVNPQELVAWSTQRAARYAGIVNAGIAPWDMTARMQELRFVRKQAGFKN